QHQSKVFPSIPSRLQFLRSTRILDAVLLGEISSFRENAASTKSATEDFLKNGFRLLAQLRSVRTGLPVPEDLQTIQSKETVLRHPGPLEPVRHLPSARISILSHDPDQKSLEFAFEKDDTESHTLLLDQTDEKQLRHLKQISRYLNPPYDVFAHQLNRNDLGWQAESLVLLPDFLIDVTAVAGCFHADGGSPLKFLIQLFLYRPPGYSILVGTSVNQMLDELILDPELQFEDLSTQLFQHNPIGFSLLQDDEVIRYFETVKTHFEHIRGLVQSHFNGKVLRLEDCLMEPSFYSVEYGIQGRLDLYYEDRESFRKHIIELKTGKPYQSNIFGINPDHHAQVTLYYLLIQSVFGKNQDTECQILYSSQASQPLRNAPILENLKKELIQLRNSLLVLQLHLAFRKDGETFILDQLNEKHFAGSEPFTKRDAALLTGIYSSLTALEKHYFREFSGFVARELFISKLGRSGLQFTEGLASLWLLNDPEKVRLFMMQPALQIADLIAAKGDFPILILKQNDAVLSNFRVGDTLILYPHPSALKEQIYKCTLIEMHPGSFHVRLRSRSFPGLKEARQRLWNLEHDSMDRAFVNQFQSLTDFAASDPGKRKLLLGGTPPEVSGFELHDTLGDIPEIVRPVLKKILSAKDYFLLWGPPGSGKTSTVLHHLVRYLHEHTGENILLLAYTNRAVDEICEALESIQPNPDYIRIGSRFAIQAKFRKQLLEEKIRMFKTRKALLQLFDRTRIFTATVASIQGKKELFSLKTFDTLVVDEASQILEPQLIGLLSRFKRSILIGDHLQLPAVSAQTEEEARIHTPELQEAGFRSLSDSLFERLLQQCMDKNWTQAYEMLQFQGRMHESVMQFPARFFYNNQLHILPNQLLARQSMEYSRYFPDVSNGLETALANHRTLYLPCRDADNAHSGKVNLTEARLVVKLIEQIYQMYRKNNREWHELSLGVITPFRAQIAQIRQQLHASGLDHIPLTVDTAERYQGGARDVIILSTVISEASQLPQISSLNAQGIDRKLNVALTRAKEQVILVGDPQALKASRAYEALIQNYTEWIL
ncbi:MAG TPA: AAA domain-containing protein, partial [Saprospiraceae bacterium]|nr:AAA domain-containing protein [Saprospiraceae bacterium]